MAKLAAFKSFFTENKFLDKITKNKSITNYFTIITVIIILLQILLLTLMLVTGGIFKQSEISAYDNFSSTVQKRGEYIQQDMRTHWSDFEPYLSDIVAKIPASGDYRDDRLLADLADDLIHMLRGSEVTGAFVILDKSPNVENNSLLYLRKYDALAKSYANSDIFMVYGGADIARKYDMALDASWRRQIKLDDYNRSFFDQPFYNASSTIDPSFLGYWAYPFQLAATDSEIITHTIPLQTKGGHAIGVIGVELSTSYVAKLLPASDIRKKDSLGYIIAKKNDAGKYETILTSNNIQKLFINPDQPLALKSISDNDMVYKLNNAMIKEKIHAAVHKLEVYPYLSPFQEEEWYLIGFTQTDYLLSMVQRITNILKISIFVSIIFGILSGVFLSRQMSRPVINLVDQVTSADHSQPLNFKSTGLYELNVLSDAIVDSNKKMLDSASRLSRIIDMLDLPIAAFEIDHRADKVSIVGKLLDILGLEASEEEEILSSANKFEDMLDQVMSVPENDEEDVYRLYTDSNRWIRIFLYKSPSQTSGLIQDVTNEILDKRQIIQERDTDSLTKLYNRASFQEHFDKWYAAFNNDSVAALVMFDLDFLKTINDTYGHKWGDYYIEETAKELRTIADENKYILARRSGDEFVMLLHSFTAKDEIIGAIEAFYYRLKEKILQFPEGVERNIAISAGYVWIDNDELNYDQLLHLADEALYYSKENNKGSYSEAKR